MSYISHCQQRPIKEHEDTQGEKQTTAGAEGNANFCMLSVYINLYRLIHHQLCMSESHILSEDTGVSEDGIKEIDEADWIVFERNCCACD